MLVPIGRFRLIFFFFFEEQGQLNCGLTNYRKSAMRGDDKFRCTGLIGAAN